MLSGQGVNFFLPPVLMHDGIFLRKDSLCQADVMISLFLLKTNHHQNGQMLLIRKLQKVSGEPNYCNYAMLDFPVRLMDDEVTSFCSICGSPQQLRIFFFFKLP